ncbi:hypothetical protein [Bifidobacterium callitrichos]|uniref:Uncharacterized protein n=1 Tax=Bifidobacterium callitrichos DSM 23973 TaxID=1437609 RepID=A0A087ACR6_9BIFI|nr:hypothetical protein [Bifidobacterium callitrichos]KFI56566.1 hypothetical protein BCAL_0161 [Bifidobacterium callitrichos DSM 23973]
MNVEPVESVLREGRCTPKCLLALGDESKQCHCRCRGSYHGVLSDSIVERNPSAGIVDEWWTHFCCLGPKRRMSRREIQRLYPDMTVEPSIIPFDGNYHLVTNLGDSFMVAINDIGDFDEYWWGGSDYYHSEGEGPKILDLFLRSLTEQHRASRCHRSKIIQCDGDNPYGVHVEITGIRDLCEAIVICEAIWQAIGVSSGGGYSMDMLMSSICLINNYWDECIESHHDLFIFSPSEANIDKRAVIPFGLSDEESEEKWEDRKKYYKEKHPYE